MDDEGAHLQELLERADALEAELRALDEMHLGDTETIVALEKQLAALPK